MSDEKARDSDDDRSDINLAAQINAELSADGVPVRAYPAGRYKGPFLLVIAGLDEQGLQRAIEAARALVESDDAKEDR